MIINPCQDRSLYFKDWCCVFEKEKLQLFCNQNTSRNHPRPDLPRELDFHDTFWVQVPPEALCLGTTLVQVTA